MIDDLFSIGSHTAKALRRTLLRYSRKPVEYNFERLPDPEYYCDMELAFREDYFDPPNVSANNAIPYVKYTLISLAIFFGYYFLGVMPMMLAAIVLVLLWFRVIVRTAIYAFNQTQAQVAAGVFLLSAIVLSALFFASGIFANKIFLPLVFGIPALILLRVVATDFYIFSAQWLHAHPSLTNAERRRSEPFLICEPDIFLASLVFLSLLTAQWFPPFLFILALSAVPIFFLIQSPLSKLLTSHNGAAFETHVRALARLLVEYFTYGSRFSQSLPGVWEPRRHHLLRRRMAVLALLLLIFSFASAPQVFFAWDTPGFRGRYIDLFANAYETNPSFRNTVETETPGLDWESIPPPKEQRRMSERINVLRGMREDASLDDSIAYDAEITGLIRTLNETTALTQERAADWYNASHGAWFQTARAHAFSNPGLLASSLAAALITGLILPLLFLGAILRHPLYDLLRLYASMERRCAVREASQSPWEWFVDRLRRSNHIAPDPINSDAAIREADHLFLGLEAANGFPVLLDKNILSDHAYISGGSGSGKTSLGILSLVTQLIRTTPPSGETGLSMPPIVIIDLKGEHALLHSVREEVRKKAVEEGRDLKDCFRLFSSEKDMPTHYFNPLGDMAHPGRYVADLANLLLDALELNHGPGYGRSFFSRKNYMTLHEALRTESPLTFDELSARIAKTIRHNQEERHQAFELMATLYGLAEFEQLKPPPDLPPGEAISMREVIEQRQVAYFWLPTVESSIIAREIANLALFSYFSAMRARAKDRAPLRQAYLVVDEFQKLAGDRFSIILQQARGFGLSAILSNQSISDLKTPTFDLRPTVLQNTRLKLYFSFSDCREMNDFAQRSGEELAYTRSGVYDLAPGGEPDAPLFDQWKHAIKPRVTTNDMIRVGDHPLQAYMDLRAGSGYTQFGGATVPLQMFHPVRWTDFQQRRDTLPWPTQEDLGVAASTQATASPEEIDQRATAVLARLDERIQAFDEDHPQLRFS